MGPLSFLWVGLGGALGSMARLGVGLIATHLWGESFPWGTIGINIVGSFIITFFSALSLDSGAIPIGPNARLFVIAGVCGGFTTFSSFSLQTVALARTGAFDRAGLNVLLSVILCLLAAWAGLVAGEAINSWTRR
jgi:CrcB protein